MFFGNIMHFIGNSSQDKMIEPVSCTEISSDTIFVVSQSSSLLQNDTDKEKVCSIFYVHVFCNTACRLWLVGACAYA